MPIHCGEHGGAHGGGGRGPGCDCPYDPYAWGDPYGEDDPSDPYNPLDDPFEHEVEPWLGYPYGYEDAYDVPATPEEGSILARYA